MEIDKAISYKGGFSFEDSESEAHIYDSSIIGSNTFTKAEPGAKISHSKIVDALLKSKSSVKGHEYNVCPSGCQLYEINDNQESCVDYGKLQYKTDTEQSQTPAASMKLMSVGDMFSQMQADPSTRELLHYRANWEFVAGQLTNIFDGDSYKQLAQQGLFSNPNDIAIGLYTNGFVNQKKGKSSKKYAPGRVLVPTPRQPGQYNFSLAEAEKICMHCEKDFKSPWNLKQHLEEYHHIHETLPNVEAYVGAALQNQLNTDQSNEDSISENEIF
ncbi:hypothetical protein J3Q64DRAFT_1830340 [Phycomyces blakesleeanus]|uniref:C2H2-type domain-containing protein n=1 Tax=Phycomyces blakesleeanus TaxID=4837 RepID=A0ABR3BAX8_PHYBL